MALEEIVSGVYGIGMGYVNAFFIVGEDGLTLVDSGLAKKKDTILGAVAGADRQPPDLKHILITHHHIDHIGSLAALKEATGAKCYVHIPHPDAVHARDDLLHGHAYPPCWRRSILGSLMKAAARYQAACGLSTTVDS